jgi:Ca-activated chloride channel family protein
MFRFGEPIWLAGLVSLPLLWIWLNRSRPSSALVFPTVRDLSPLKSFWGHRRTGILRCSRLLSLAFLIVALAQPQAGLQEEKLHSDGTDIILCLDTSGSMQARDIKVAGETVDRISAVKSTALAFIEHRKLDRIGIVVFGGQALTLCPLTLDHGMLTRLLTHIRPEMVGDRTTIGNALALSAKRLREASAISKIIVLVTDGIHNAGTITPNEAASIAHALGIRIYTIGIGGDEIVSIERETPFGKETQRYSLKIDTETLKQIASLTGGIFFRADNQKRLQHTYQSIDQLETTRFEVKSTTAYRDLSPLLIALALGLFGLSEILAKSLFLKIP